MLISVIVRTKNESYWLKRLFYSLKNQSKMEIDLIVVDNESSDNTLEISKENNANIIKINDDRFTYGLSLNLGIEQAKSNFIAIISGHCIPADDKWLYNLYKNFSDSYIAGVYGRQIPLPDSSDFDKRDLWTTFGIERKIQTKDFFFHNANSMIKKDIWEKFKFDEKSKGVEDRLWAKKILESGYSIIYEPSAAVYHFHGIHQGRDEKRAARVTKVIQDFYE